MITIVAAAGIVASFLILSVLLHDSSEPALSLRSRVVLWILLIAIGAPSVSTVLGS